MERSVVHSRIYWVLLALMVVAIPTSNFLMSLAQVLLMVHWISQGQWHNKLAKARRQPLLWAFVALFLVHVVWCLVSSNYNYAINDLRKKLPLLVVPLVVLTSDGITRKQMNALLAVYCSTMLFVSAYSLVNHLLHPELVYRSLFPYISHIRLALNACMVIFVLLYFIDGVRSHTSLSSNKRKIYITVLILLIGWYIGYLLLLQSYTGFIALMVALPVVLYCQIRRRGSAKYRAVFFAGLILVAIAAASVVGYYVHSYYSLKPLSAQPLAQHTANGNAYTHHQDGFVEYGNYINNYICHAELADQWSKVSNKPLEYITPNGYTIEPTLIRYLNSKGYTKDSVGISHLGPGDIAAIEQGRATIYEAGSNVVPQMIYRLLFEYENYRVYRSVKNFSMLQRFELWHNTCRIIKQHPLLGVGTGDVADEIHNNLVKNASELKDSNMRTHNQYLTLLLTFGILGTVVIVAFFAYAICKERLFGSLLFMAYFCIFMVSFISEDTLETAAGCLFCTFFFALFGVQKQANSTSLAV